MKSNIFFLRMNEEKNLKSTTEMLRIFERNIFIFI